MPDPSEMKSKLLQFIRQREALKLQGDNEKLADLAEMPDDFLLKKFIWTLCLIGGPSVFVGLPLVLCVLGIFVPPAVMEILWIFVKIGMALMLLIFCLAVAYTLRSNR